MESTPISIYPRWHGMFALVDIDAPWSTSARMSVAIALVSRFIGGRISGSRAIVSGLARYVAREVLFASGTTTPPEYAEEVNGELAATLFSDRHGAAVARVALEANRFDAAIQKASGGERTLRELLRGWVASSHNVKEDDLGMAAGGRTPRGALGKCFARATLRFHELDLGFDEAKTRKSRRTAGVHGAAEKAGLHDGERVVSIRYDATQAEHPVHVVVERSGKNVEVTYKPIGRSRSAPGWRAIPGADASTCGQP